MQHRAAVAVGPTRTTGHLLTDKPVLHHQVVVGECFLVEEMAELVVELIVSVVPNLEQPVLYSECVADVITQRVAGDLCCPAREIFAVEKVDPAFLRLLSLLSIDGERVNPTLDK